MKKLCLIALLALAPLALQATPTRLLTVDNMNQVVPDDWDATTYYSLAPHFKNHWYADSYATGKSFGWAFLDVNVATLVVWYNKDFEGDGVYDGALASSPAIVGLSSTSFNSDVVNSVEAREKRITDPDTKLGLGLAYELLDNLNLGLCFRLAEQNNTKNVDNQTAAGGPLYVGSSTAYHTAAANVLGGAFSNVSFASKATNTQADNAILISPQFSYTGDSFTLDAKFDMFWPGVDNKHTEDVFNGGNKGSITQSLKDKGRMNWFARPKLRYMFNPNSSLVLRASYGKLDLSTQHRVAGNFNISGSLGNSYDFMDSSEEFGIDTWDSFLGVVKTWDKGRSLVTWGLGANGSTTKVLGTVNQLKAGATTYNDVVAQQTSDVSITQLAVPVMVGSEISLSSWCKARANVQRNFFTASNTKTVTTAYNNDGTEASHQTTEVGTDFGKGWTFNSGFGLNFGAFSWDTALNTGFLSGTNTTGIINPLYQSSFTYEF